MVLKLNLSAEVESDFREIAMKMYGYKKGSIGKAAEKAFTDFTIQKKSYAKELEEMGDPVDAITGMMKHVKETSLELQKGTNKWRGERYDRHRR